MFIYAVIIVYSIHSILNLKYILKEKVEIKKVPK